MAILGVLLGITMTVLAGALIYGHRQIESLVKELGFAREANADTRSRLKVLESRKAYTDAAATQSTAGKAENTRKVTMRTWNENIGAAETK